jgi:hypothetical protein
VARWTEHRSWPPPIYVRVLLSVLGAAPNILQAPGHRIEQAFFDHARRTPCVLYDCDRARRPPSRAPARLPLPCCAAPCCARTSAGASYRVALLCSSWLPPSAEPAAQPCATAQLSGPRHVLVTSAGANMTKARSAALTIAVRDICMCCTRASGARCAQDLHVRARGTCDLKKRALRLFRVG